jgi:hypothetical protein
MPLNVVVVQDAVLVLTAYRLVLPGTISSTVVDRVHTMVYNNGMTSGVDVQSDQDTCDYDSRVHTLLDIYDRFQHYNVIHITDRTVAGANCARQQHVLTNHIGTFYQVAHFSTKVLRQGAKTQASSLLRCLCCFEGQVQQGTPNLCSMLSQRLAMHLRCFEETRQAGPDEEEEPGWHTLHQGLQAATFSRWQRVWQVQGST